MGEALSVETVTCRSCNTVVSYTSAYGTTTTCELHAAAQDLLAALEDLITAIEGGGDKGISQTVAEASATIAKAHGRDVAPTASTPEAR